MSIDHNLADSIKGFMDPAEGERLYATASEAAAMGPCLEIGSYCGKSTYYLGRACQARSQVLFSVDHHGGSEEQQPGQPYCDPDLLNAERTAVDTLPHFRRTLEKTGLQDTVIAIVSRSTTLARVWTTPLSLVFIDGSHTDQSAFADYNGWARHVMPGGFLLIHDIFQDPADGGQAPWRIYELAKASGFFDPLPMTGALAVLKRRSFTDAPPYPGN